VRVFPVHIQEMILGLSRRHQKWARTQVILKVTEEAERVLARRINHLMYLMS
jgi:hypothetical protein